MPTKCRGDEELWILAGNKFQIFGAEIRNAREIQGCIVEHRVEKKRKIAESV